MDQMLISQAFIERADGITEIFTHNTKSDGMSKVFI